MSRVRSDTLRAEGMQVDFREESEVHDADAGVDYPCWWIDANADADAGESMMHCYAHPINSRR